jgi:transposase-like protein
LSIKEERFTAAGAEDAEGALRNTNTDFKSEISNLESEISKLAVSRRKSQRPLCVLCACGGELL